ncbi:LPP20 family lipoprotein [Thalassotalea sp. PLHSN55]|uniref:LPP20 family lipoprotein n=1 Tax=Thalassotalea sp. PLHSN55 TaxID=3435888 RepID=UPI003F8710E3
MNIKQWAKVLTLIVSCVVGLFGCSTVYDKHVQWQPVEPEEFPIITAIGYAPISLQKSEHKTQRMLMAINASKIAAYAELAEQVYGQQLDANVTVANLLVENQHLSASVKGIIRGAKVVKSYPMGDTYTTELRLDFKDVYQIYLANFNNKEIRSVEYF